MLYSLQISSTISRPEYIVTYKTKIHKPEKRTGPKETNLPSIMMKLAEENTPSDRCGVIVPTNEAEKGELPIVAEICQKKAKKEKCPKV